MHKYYRAKTGHYVSKDGRFQIRLEPGTYDKWVLTEYEPTTHKRLEGCFIGHSLKECKEEVERLYRCYSYPLTEMAIYVEDDFEILE